MQVVANSTPLINFSAIQRLDILQSLFGRIIVPEGVWHEVVIKASEYETSRLIAGCEFIVRSEIKDQILFRNLLIDLHRGESEVIVLALEYKADLVILDEKEARFYADYHGLNYIGTVGCLLKAKEQSIIKRIKPFLDGIKEKSKFWFSDGLYSEILKAAGEV